MARSKASNAALWVVMILLIGGLAGFGVSNFGASARTVATVGDREVDVQEFMRALEAQSRRYQELTGQALSIEQMQALGLDRAALGQLVRDAALENAATNAGISVGDERVSEEVLRTPAFQTGNGFDRTIYEQSLRRNGLTVRDFEEQIRNNTSASILRVAVADGVETPGVYVDTLFNFALEERDVTWARLGADDLAEPIAEPTDAELRSYWEENPAPFTLGETRVIDYAWLSPDDVASEIEVDEEQLRGIYQDNIDEFVIPERRLVERLVFTNEANAEAAMARIDSGEATFEDLATERGLELANIDLGEVEPRDLDGAAEAVFALKEPGVVGPVPSSLGPALFRVNAILNAQETTFEQARDDLAAEAAADRARRLINDRISQVEDLLAGGASPQDLADRTEMNVGQIEWLEDVTDGIAAYTAFRQAAVALQEGDFAEVVQLDDGGIVVPVLAEVRPPAVQDFEVVSEDVVTLWEQQATQDALAAQAEVSAEALRGGDEMAGLGLALETDRGLQRNGFVEGTPPTFIETIFEMDANEVRVLSADGEAWLVRLDTVQGPDTTTTEAQAQRLLFADQTSNELSQSLLNAFTQAVLDDTEVDVNPSAMNLVTQSIGHGG